jgi:ADP-ribose pyrophosphatase YjhB (NUDIX family)
MDILPLLDELQIIARNGLHYAQNPYDRERYERLMELTTRYYGEALDLPPAAVQERLFKELGYVTPKVGADAAIFNEVGEILLVLRADDHRWCLPCGWVEPYESPVEAAVREAREETGLIVKPIQLVDVFYRAAGSYKGTHALIAVVYLCERIGGVCQVVCVNGRPQAITLGSGPQTESPADYGCAPNSPSVRSISS